MKQLHEFLEQFSTDDLLTACGVMQDGLEQKELQLQDQVAMNQQLMKRKEDMEWQLMSLLAQVPACQPGLPLGTEAPITMPHSIDFSLFFSTCLPTSCATSKLLILFPAYIDGGVNVVST